MYLWLYLLFARNDYYVKIQTSLKDINNLLRKYNFCNRITLKEDWDFLIILDACRYDYFKRVYKKYIDRGNLKKAISPTTRTMAWLNKVFPGFYDDIVYISASPYITSKAEIVGQYGDKYDGKKHFYKIIDVWDFGWNDTVTSVFPGEINKAFLDVRREHRDKRFILHYMQPHEPYISEKYTKYIPGIEKNIRTGAIIKTRSGLRKDPRKKTMEYDKKSISFTGIIKRLIFKFFSEDTSWKIRNHIVYRRIIKFLKGPPKSQISAIIFNEGWHGLREAYRENLELALRSVKKIIDIIEGKILITSDHGEFLGEYGLYRHPDKPRKPENTEIPWLGINKRKRERIKESEKISKKIDDALDILKNL